MWSGYGYGYGYAALSFNVTHISTCYGYTVTDSYPATLAVLFNIIFIRNNSAGEKYTE